MPAMTTTEPSEAALGVHVLRASLARGTESR